MKSAFFFLGLAGLVGAAAPAQGWEGQLLIDTLPTMALVQESSSAPWMQEQTTEIMAQGALSQTQPLAEGLSLSGTLWVMADTLPAASPFSTPAAKIDLQARVLELKLGWEAIPGTLIWSVGKEVIHPSSGFFRTPLDVLSRAALAGTANLSGSATGAWEEGWTGTDLTLLVGSLTVSDTFLPHLTWSPTVDQVLQYVSSQQPDWQDLARMDLRVGDADVRLLGLFSTSGLGSTDPAIHFTGGAGLDTSIGDAFTVRAELSVADTQERITATSASPPFSFTTEAVAWAPRALAGFTWTGPDQLSVMAEYYYNGPGFGGADYAQIISYTQALRNAPGAGPDLLDQLGAFSAGQQYAFVRVAGTVEGKVTASAWTAVNLQDLSGLTGVVADYASSTWSVTASLVNAWGTTSTEAGLSPLLWKADLQMSLFL